MAFISEAEFASICDGIRNDRDAVIKHNPIGTNNEILLWMLLACIISYLSLTDLETPCFTGVPDEKTYRDAILFVLSDRRIGNFEAEPIIDRMLSLK
ncbi:MAG TPA: hypothetical protein VK612_11900 [Pyrinomonadaceae bacterium]|nr:hypothetical protein [Pyrinomonadaceae bacterium]